MKSLLAFKLEEIRLGNNQAGTIESTYGTGGVSTLVSLIVKNSLTVAGIIFLALLIFGGITFIMSAGSGDAKKAEQGKKAITNAAIGFAIVLLAFTIIQIIEVITGLSILNPTNLAL